MKLEMEILPPASCFKNPEWLFQERKCSVGWTAEENKFFENLLAVHDKDTPDRWQKVAAMIPGKTVGDVMKQYKVLVEDVSEIEAGRIPIPDYSTPRFILDWEDNHSGYDYDTSKQSYGIVGKRSSSTRPCDQERKKGVPWTEEEHKLFLMGLKKYGKGDWRNISRNFVITRTPTQVASHAQKYFIRQLSGGKDKRRASIHDITTVNLNEARTPSPDTKRPSSPERIAVVPQRNQQQQRSNSAPMARTPFQWNQPNHGASMAFNAAPGNSFSVSPAYGFGSYGRTMQGSNLHRGGVNGSCIGPQSMGFQM